MTFSLFYWYFVIYFTISIVLLLIFLQSLGLEASPGFGPVLIASQPNSARQPLSEFFLQLGPERYFLLQLNNGQIVTLRDFSPVCSTLFWLSNASFTWISQGQLCNTRSLQRSSSVCATLSLLTGHAGFLRHCWRKNCCCCHVSQEQNREFRSFVQLIYPYFYQHVV